MSNTDSTQICTEDLVGDNRLTRADVDRIVAADRSKHLRPDLCEVDLRGADLRGADLAKADLIKADLSDANLNEANLYGASLSGANLRWASLCDANLIGASLGGANLRLANLREANLSGANLYGAELSGANLRGANLYGARSHLLRLDGLPSGQATLTPTLDGWRLSVGCWDGTVQNLRDLIAGTDWPEAEGDEQELRRPGLSLLADLCDDHIARHPYIIDSLAMRWGATEGA